MLFLSMLVASCMAVDGVRKARLRSTGEAVSRTSTNMRWPAAHSTTAPDGLLAVSAYAEKDVLIGIFLASSNLDIHLAEIVHGSSTVGCIAKKVSNRMLEAQMDSHPDLPFFESHEAIERDLSCGTLVCSDAALCLASTPAMRTLGARIDGNGHASAALIEPLLTADGEGGGIGMDLEALLTYHASNKLSSYQAGWKSFAEGASVWPVAAAVAGSLVPSHRDLDAILFIMQQTLNGEAHIVERHLLHRDLKPPNIMLDGSHGTAKLIDFGTVCIVAAEDGANELAGAAVSDKLRCTSDDITGSPSYMQPNPFAQGGYTSDAKTGHGVKIPVTSRHGSRGDLFVLGIMFVELLVGRAWPSSHSRSPLPVSVPVEGYNDIHKFYDKFTRQTVMQSTTLAHFLAAADVPEAARDDVSRARLLTLIRIAASSPSDHLSVSTLPADGSAPIFASSPLGALATNLVPPPPVGGAKSAHQCIPLWSPNYCLYAGGASCPDHAALPAPGADPNAWLAERVRAAAGAPTPLLTAGWWAPDASGSWAGTSCVYDASRETTSPSRSLDAVLAAAPAVAVTPAQRAALVAILDVVRSLLRVGVEPASAPATDIAAIESAIDAARLLLVAAAAAPPADAAATLARQSACVTTCLAAIARATALAPNVRSSPVAASAAACPRPAAGAALSDDQFTCDATMAELGVSGVFPHLGESAATGLTMAAKRSLCRTAVCRGSAVPRVSLPGTIQKAPLRNTMGTYSSYSFALECARAGPSTPPQLVLTWTHADSGDSWYKSLRAYGKSMFGGHSSSATGRAVVDVKKPAAPTATCPRNGATEVPSCLDVSISSAISKGIVISQASSIKLTGITADAWANALTQLKAACADLPLN